MPASLDRVRIREKLERFDLRPLFIEELGWDYGGDAIELEIDGNVFFLTAIAQKRGMVAYQYIAESEDEFPKHPTRQKIEKAVAKIVHEHIVIYARHDNSAQYWQWVKRETGQPDRQRQHIYSSGQTGEALIQKLEHLAFTLDEEADTTISDVSGRVRAAFDVENVTKKFYDRFKREHDAFLKFIEGIQNLSDREWYASLMLNRMMFIYFVQKRGFLDNDPDYLRNRLHQMQKQQGKGQFFRFYRLFLLRLFHEGLAKPEAGRQPELVEMLGKVPYLNGGLFDVHELEHDNNNIQITDEAFEKVFNFFDAYQWHLDDRPLRNDTEINPDVLGYIFEKYINQKQMGAYYTKEDITGYISRNTIIPHLFDQAKKECPIAFEPNGGIWRLLQDDPDRYFFDEIRHGITYDIYKKIEFKEVRSLPSEIPDGLDDASLQSTWNRQADIDFGLQSETWREYMARRKRYEEVRDILATASVNSVNDLITYNLDIEKFTQDVISQSEGPELVRAFWKAIKKVTILDPTCGSGAFLFAALNILDPLYVTCLESMEGFLDDLDRSKRKHHPETMSDFRNVLIAVSEHASKQYFVLKSIIIGNLYGVDIMEEAVEICKLRLFLKLVSQLKSYDQIEPLPDIDFNIRSGNTLVGFTSHEEVKVSLGTDIVKLLALPEIAEGAELADRAFKKFQEMQSVQHMDASLFSRAKVDLADKLNSLRAELNFYLGEEAGVNADNVDEYQKWLSVHRPFHWFVEFYGIMRDGGFDVITGNPPYVEIPPKTSRELLCSTFRTSLARWSRDEDLYTLVLERSLRLLKTNGKYGMILPLSLTFSTKRPFVLLRQILSEETGEWWWSHFDRIPSALFGNDVRTRCTIAILSRNAQADKWIGHTTWLSRWEAEQREALFPKIIYADFAAKLDTGIPKLPSSVQSETLMKLLSVGRNLSMDLMNSVSFSQLSNIAPNFPNHCVFVGGTAYNWFPAWREIPETTNAIGGPSLPARTAAFRFDNDDTANIVFALLCSSLGYWWWAVSSDGFNLKKWLLQRFPLSVNSIPEKARPELAQLGEALRIELRKHYVFKDNKGRIGNFYLPACFEITLKIDNYLSAHVDGLTSKFFTEIRDFNIRFSRADFR